MERMKKRRPFLLLEMMIALVLMSTVMAMLFSGFYGAITAKNKARQEKERALNFERLRLRFGILFKDVIDFKKISTGDYYIKYKGGMDHKPNFRSEIEAILRLKDKILTLISWTENGEPRKEILGENIEDLSFDFFDVKTGIFDPQYPKKKPFMMKIKVNGTELPIFL